MKLVNYAPYKIDTTPHKKVSKLIGKVIVKNFQGRIILPTELLERQFV